ncbi:MATE family efflux transporter [Paucilactobacillus sp. N302-9]
MKHNIDLTTGTPFFKIIVFSIPLVGGSLFQQLYNFIDTIIVGRLIGVEALAAVGAYYPLSFLILGFVQGSCVGFSIPLAQSVGAKDEELEKQFLFHGILICVIMAVVLTPIMIWLTPYILTSLNTPQNIMNLATTFTTISFVGIPANILFNYSSNVLRSFGDSVHPFYFLLVSLLLNILLALIFVTIFHMGIAGIAIATVISEFFSGFLNVAWFYFNKRFDFVKSYNFKFSSRHLKKICLIGFPMGFEYSVSAIGAIIMQDAINLLGTASIAAQSAGDKIRQLFTLPMESVGMGIATFMAQNYGANKIDRVKKGVWQGSLIQICYSVVALLVVMAFKQPLISVVLGTTSGGVYDKANQYLISISLFFVLHGLLMIFRNTIQGLGHSFYAVLSGVGELIGRSIGAVLSMAALGYTAICYSNQIAWGISLIYCIIIVFMLLKHLTNEKQI